LHVVAEYLCVLATPRTHKRPTVQCRLDRREGVTEGALKLQHAGLIQYTRGHITVLDRGG